MSPVLLTYDELPSTHEYAISLLSKTAPQEATVIVAGHQTAGKGRYERKWSSQHNSNLLLSGIFYPTHLNANQAFYLNIISTLTTSSLLEDHNISSIEVKWPNDVLIDQKKIAGTLIQNQLSGLKISSSVISIGLNVNQTEWPTDILATSMLLETKKEHVILEIAHQWIEKLITYIQISKTRNGLASLKKQWLNQLYCFGIPHDYQHNDGQCFTATLSDVLDNGQLELLIDGKSEVFHMDEIRQVRR